MGTFDAGHREIHRLASVQHGVLSLAQLRSHGFSKKRVRALVQSGVLTRQHRGVYVLGLGRTWRTLCMAAWFAGGSDGAISHRSGVYLIKLLPLPAQPGPVNITVPGRHRVGDDRLIVHETTNLPHYEIRDVEGIPVTSPIRTLIDFAGDDATNEELDRAVAEAFALGLTNRVAMLRALPQRRGAARLRVLLDDHRGPKKTRSRPERGMLTRLRSAGAPEPLTNHKIGPWEVDFYWPPQRLVLEVDAYNTHSSPWAMKRDRRKDAYLQERGLEVTRVMDDEIDEVAVARIVRRLGERGAVDDGGDVGGAAVRAGR